MAVRVESRPFPSRLSSSDSRNRVPRGMASAPVKNRFGRTRGIVMAFTTIHSAPQDDDRAAIELRNAARPDGDRHLALARAPSHVRVICEPLPPGALFGSAHLCTAATAVALAADGKTLHGSVGARIAARFCYPAAEYSTRFTQKRRLPPCWFSPDRRFVAALNSESVGRYDAETAGRKRIGPGCWSRRPHPMATRWRL